MSLLDHITDSPPVEGQRIAIYGQEKMGKTTLACDSPNALLVPLEDGHAGIHVRSLPRLTHWEHVQQLMVDLDAGVADGTIGAGTTLVWDSVTALERMMQDYTLRTSPGYDSTKDSMNSVHGGYGKGWGILTANFVGWLNHLDRLKKFGINHVLICHAITLEVQDPAYGVFHQHDVALYSPKSSKSSGPREALVQWADMLGFIHEPMFISKTERGQGANKETILAQGISQGKGRVLEIERTPAWVAGNRYHLTEQIQIPADGGWNYLAAAIHTGTGGKIDVYKR